MDDLKTPREVAEVVIGSEDIQWLFSEPGRVPIADAAVDERRQQLRRTQRSFLRRRGT